MRFKDVVVKSRTYNGFTIKPFSLEDVGYFCEVLQNGLLEDETRLHEKLSEAIHEAQDIADELAETLRRNI